MKINVKAKREGLILQHPIDGKLPDAGGMWTADQFTFRRIRDGDIEQVVDDAAAKTQAPDSGSDHAEAAPPEA